MSAPNLPNTLLKLGLALAKHHIKNVIGDAALEIAASTLTDVGGEKVQAKVDSIFASKEGQKELLKAAKSADERFKEKCKDNDLRQLFTMDYGNLPSVQTAIAELPEALDDESLRETLFAAFRNDSPKRISDEQINEGVSIYIESLQGALLPLEKFGLRIIYNTLLKIGKDVGDIKKLLEKLGEQIHIGQQDLTDTKSSSARFLVPFPHNPDFVGRDEELSSLHEMLQQGQSIVGIRPTVLVGLGGIGKTQLAVEYAHAYRADYPSGVFWLNAINPLLFEFSDLAEKLEMADRDTPRDKAARKAWNYLDTHPDTLVIFDNVLEPSELNIPFSPDLVPANLRCRTLFTTRQRDFPRTFQPFEVKVLPEMAAMKLLLRSRPEVLEEHHPEWGWARIVCAYLGWLPLALELAAAYLGAYPEVSITGYLERLRTEGSLETVDESEVRAVDLPTRVEEILKAAAAGNLEIKHQVAVSATLQTQWKRLDDDDAKLLFRAAGQFPEASWIPIPRLGLMTGIESDAKTGRPSPLSIVLSKLHAVSLIEELTDDQLRLHPLVQEFSAQLSPTTFRLEMAERVAMELSDLLRLQQRVINYGVNSVLEDLRTALGYCIERPESDMYRVVSKIERILDKQTHGLRSWNAQEEPTFFLQQIRHLRNETFAQDIHQWQWQAESELERMKLPYLLERFPILSNPAELRTFIGHTETVMDVALSLNGQIAVSASLDGMIKVWEVATGRELRTLAGHTDRVLGVALSLDGQLAISASSDRTLKLWDVETGHEVRTLIGHTEAIQGVALSANKKLAVSASWDKTLKVWDLATGLELRTLIGHSDRVSCVALTADGRIAASVSNDQTLRVWNVETGRKLRVFTEDIDLLTGVALSNDGRRAVCGSWDGESLKVWDIQTGNELRSLARHSDSVQSTVAISADGRLIASGSSYNSLEIWDMETGNKLTTLKGHSRDVSSVALSSDGRLAISGSDDNTLKVWDLSDMLKASALQRDLLDDQKKRPQENESQLPNRYLALADPPHNSFGHTDWVTDVALSTDGDLAVSSSFDATIKLWNVKTGRELCTLVGHEDMVNGVKLSAGKRLAVSASEDLTLKVWDLDTETALRTLTGHNESVLSVALSANGQIAVSASDDMTLKIWNPYTGKELRTLTGHTDSVRDVVLSNDELWVVSASDDQTLKIWDVKTARHISTLTGHLGTVNSIALSSDRQLAVSASDDQTLKVWDMEKKVELRTLTGHHATVSGVALTEDKKIAVSSSWDKTLKVWDVSSGRCLATLLVDVFLTCCAMSANGKALIVGDSRGRIHFFELINIRESHVTSHNDAIELDNET